MAKKKARKSVKKSARKSKKKRKPNPEFMKPLPITEALAAVVGRGPMPRTQVTKKIWAYIKARKLQNPKKRREIVADDKLKKVFGGKARVDMFEMTKLVNKHLG